MRFREREREREREERERRGGTYGIIFTCKGRWENVHGLVAEVGRAQNFADV